MTGTPSEETTPKPKRWRRSAAMVALALVILCSGMVIGGAVTAGVLWNRLVYNIQNPENIPTRVVAGLERRLDLTEEQSAEVQAITMRHFEALQELRREIHPEVDAHLHALRDEVAQVLEPEQAEEWHAIFARLYDRLRPPLPAES